ncbi:MAG TPA: DUF4160 domain-containing protein [Thermoanaerobaculia bacterium]|nr:DUF4160 domain-containing protein [Thermoanaerobaculia bacterium]
MPAVATIGPYRFHFFSNERGEPPHIHVREGRKHLKVWLDAVEVASCAGFASHEQNRIVKLVIRHREEFLEAWNDYFGDRH